MFLVCREGASSRARTEGRGGARGPCPGSALRTGDRSPHPRGQALLIQPACSAQTSPEGRSAGDPWASLECAPPRGSQGPSRLTLPASSCGVPGTTRAREDSTLRARIRVGRVEVTLLGGRGLVPHETCPGWLPPV